jgi:hypothetical protein
MVTILDQYVAIVGLDWADKKHDVCLIEPRTSQIILSLNINRKLLKCGSASYRLNIQMNALQFVSNYQKVQLLARY